MRPRKETWFWDFHTYIVDDHIEMAYIDTRIPYDVTVSLKYYTGWEDCERSCNLWIKSLNQEQLLKNSNPNNTKKKNNDS